MFPETSRVDKKKRNTTKQKINCLLTKQGLDLKKKTRRDLFILIRKFLVLLLLSTRINRSGVDKGLKGRD